MTKLPDGHSWEQTLLTKDEREEILVHCYRRRVTVEQFIHLAVLHYIDFLSDPKSLLER